MVSNQVAGLHQTLGAQIQVLLLPLVSHHMDKAKQEDHILVVDLEHHLNHIHPDLSHKLQHSHIHLELQHTHIHPDLSHKLQHTHIQLELQHTHIHPDLSHKLQHTHIQLDLSLEHHPNHMQLDLSLEHHPNHMQLDLSLEHHPNHMQLDLSLEHHPNHMQLDLSLEHHPNHMQLEPQHTHIHLDLSLEHQVHLQVLLGLIQGLHPVNSLLHQMPHNLLDLLDPIQEPLQDNNQIHQMPHTLLDPTQERPLGHKELQLGPILMHLGNILQLSILLGLLECQDPIPTLLGHQVNHIQVHQVKAPHQVDLILLLMVSQVLQELARAGLGILIHGDLRVASIHQTQICHTQPPVHFQILELHHPYHGVLCLQVSGGHLLHFLELVDPTLNQAHIHEAVCSSG
ncbi:uncharacterized protein LOC122924948 [Bufo gargarizans]|uniref:uncharacterized protein LOC122924948 n=1 Tax=Bufo gargarizans TaxID=30331 RepID=UPI001CF5A39F|nr:uncharacterized protein LOC122924948 [Bufo gargarizans]